MQFIRGNKFLHFLTISVLMLLWITAFNSCTTSNLYKERNNFSASLSTRELLIRDFLSNIKSANNFIESQYDTARFLQQRGKHLAAIEVLREILSIDPLNVKALNVIGVSYDFLGGTQNLSENGSLAYYTESNLKDSPQAIDITSIDVNSLLTAD